MELPKKKQPRSFARKVIEKANDQLTASLHPESGSRNEYHERVRKIIFIVIVSIIAILIHLFSSPDRWIRI